MDPLTLSHPRAMLAGIVPNPEAAFISRVTRPVTVLLSSSALQTQLMAPEAVPQMPIKGKRKAPWEQISPVLLQWPPPDRRRMLPVRPSFLGTAFSPKFQTGFDADFNRS